MKRLFIISFVILSACFQAEAQLLEDNQNRLKTAKAKSKGFLFFRSKKVKSGSGANRQVVGAESPRYSQGGAKFRTKGIAPGFSAGSPFRARDYKITPRYSGGNPFRGSRYKITPRYSFGNPFRGAKYKVTPRYSGGNPFRGSQYKVTPRYSAGNPFRGSRYRVTPRYSPGNPFRGSQYKVTPRYSAGNPFRGARYKVTPRYSPGNPFRGARYKVTPRYSPGNPFRARDYKVTPRYSVGNPFRGMRFKVQPRYSPGNPFRGVDYKVDPRYSNPKGRFVVNGYLKRQLKYYNETSKWKGDWKIAKRGKGDQHPSSNYHFAMRFSNPKIRKMFRKWNIFWVRLNGNKEVSKGVRANVRSPKFDKHEKDIWNN